jgi:hypothetical protein
MQASSAVAVVNLASAPAIPGGAGAAAAAGAAIGAVFVVTIAFPLATYTAVLALFGLAHVLSELNYLDRRFGAQLAGGLLPRLGAPILAAVTARGAALLGVVSPAADVICEIGAAGLLVWAVVPAMRRRSAAGMGVGAALAAGAVFAPFQVLLALAVLHNLTPLGFVAEATGGRERRRSLALLAVAFVALPLLIATGLPAELLSGFGLGDPEAGLFAAAGPLALNLGAYVPAALSDSAWALPAFSACVFAQVMHYAAVILLYPRLARRVPARTLLPWPRHLAGAIAVSAAALAVGFFFDYHAARKLYALAALVHAWIEIPLLVLVLGGWPAAQRATA